MKANTARSQATFDPDMALKTLIDGNLRFQENLREHRNLLQQVNETSKGQFPFATILSCIDSRTSAELIFDLGLGDIFSIRIAGNFVNDDIIGSMEYACFGAGSKLIVVLGHTNCGAVTSACKGPGRGYMARLLDNIRPAVEATIRKEEPIEGNDDFYDKVAYENVHMAIKKIRNDSKDLAKLELDKKIRIVGAIYDVKTGAVNFFET